VLTRLLWDPSREYSAVACGIPQADLPHSVGSRPFRHDDRIAFQSLHDVLETVLFDKEVNGAGIALSPSGISAVFVKPIRSTQKSSDFSISSTIRTGVSFISRLRQRVTSMLGNRNIMAFVCTTDPNRARPFYRDTLGLNLVEEHSFALVFDANGTSLRVSISNELTPAKHTVLGWEVPDIAASIQELQSKGVEFSRYEGMNQDANGIWRAPGGAQIAWFRDPDGNVLSLTQF
jgi:catechol 2,3-dioxygenase-like lactoylglutathione lyase family enzyme